MNANMCKIFRGSLIVGALVVVNVVGCNRSGNGVPSQGSTQGDQSPNTALVARQAPSENKPSRFWHDEEVGRIIESMGHDDVYVFRWEGGSVKAWVQLNAEKWDFDSANVVQDALPKGDERPAPVASSGEIIVVMGKRDGEVYDCRVVANVDVQGVGVVTVSSEPVEIRLSSDPNLLVSDDMAFLSFKDGETEEKFFEVRFSEPE